MGNSSTSAPRRSLLALQGRVAAILSLLTALGACGVSTMPQTPTLPAGAAAKTVSGITVTLLGTGSPRPSLQRFSQSILVEASNEKLLFDFGRGATIRLAEINVPAKAITAHFITHLHSDHTIGLPDVWLTGFLSSPYGGRDTPMKIYGPKGTAALVQGLSAAYADEVRIRQEDEKVPVAGARLEAHEVDPGVIYERNGVRVTAFATPHDHAGVITANYAYRIDCGRHSVVLSSDTVYNEKLAEFSKGVDLLLHEVAEIEPGMLQQFPRFAEVLAHHTTATEAGRIFSIAKPRLAAYTHIIVVQAGGGERDVSVLKPLTRKTYAGPLVLGEDLMRFRIDGDIRVFDAKGVPVQADGS